MTARQRLIVQIAAALVGICLVTGGAFLAGRASGADLDAARSSGRADGQRLGTKAGERAGAKAGEPAGRAAGTRDGYKRSYQPAYKRAYNVAYGKWFRKSRAAEKARLAAKARRAERARQAALARQRAERARRAAASCPNGSYVGGRCFTPNYGTHTDVRPATESECGPGWHPVGVTGACAPDD